MSILSDWEEGQGGQLGQPHQPSHDGLVTEGLPQVVHAETGPTVVMANLRLKEGQAAAVGLLLVEKASKEP